MARTRTDVPPRRSACPVAGALDVVGDRWTLLVLRDALFLGKRRFGEFLASPERISSNTLTARLARLERCGILRRVACQKAPVRYRYEPTPKGRDLLPLLREAARWGLRHVRGTRKPTPAQLRALSRGGDGAGAGGRRAADGR